MSGEEQAPQGVRLSALVHGHVQGVYFRDFCRRTAAVISSDGGSPISGYARNLPNGTTVEVVVEGPRAALEALLEALRVGPGMARVRSVEARWETATNEFDGFRLRH